MRAFPFRERNAKRRQTTNCYYRPANQCSTFQDSIPNNAKR